VTIYDRPIPSRELERAGERLSDWETRIGNLERRGSGDGAAAPFYEAVAELATTRELLGYWRLGEGASPFLDTSGHPSGPSGRWPISSGARCLQWPSSTC